MSLLAQIAGVDLWVAPGIRRATLDDVPALIEFGRTAYPGRPIEQAAPWLAWYIQNPDRLVLIGLSSAGAAQVTTDYGLERRARLSLLAAKPVPGAVFESLRILRAMVDWAKEKGAVGTFRVDSGTGVDFGSFAKRLGGRQVLTDYEIPL